jgi:hypothetical protein
LVAAAAAAEAEITEEMDRGRDGCFLFAFCSALLVTLSLLVRRTIASMTTTTGTGPARASTAGPAAA